MRDESIKLNGVKDPYTKIWKIRTSVLGPKYKALEPTCIRHPETWELIAKPEEIKKVTQYKDTNKE